VETDSSSFLRWGDALILQLDIGLSSKENTVKKKDFCGTPFASLPFWQIGRGNCHFGSP